MEKNILLNMKNITKEFPGVTALKCVDFDLEKGEIHILCGENGAGKSTLMKILAGIYPPTEGTILLDREKITIKDPLHSEHLGIAIIFQELSLSPTVSVAENIFLGREFINQFGLVNRKRMYEETKKLLGKLNCFINPNTLVQALPVAQQQLVQIAKALSLNSRILIMDEPFSALGDEDSENLFKIMISLKDEGISIIYIDHRIDNFFRIGDRITVLRDGETVETRVIKSIKKNEVVKLMVGRSIDEVYPKYNKKRNRIQLSVRNFSSAKVKNINFTVYKGEIFGLGGLVGAGRSELFRALYGCDQVSDGEVYIDGKKIGIKNPSDAIDLGIGYVPEDRKIQALFLKRSIRFNSTIACINDFKINGFINQTKERTVISSYIKSLDIKTSGVDKLIQDLSGGNQQKIILSRWLMMKNLKILLLDEPTRGIDVGAKYEIYKLINDLANKGLSIILITSELPELLGLCDRIAVLRNGRISGIVERADMSQEKIMHLCV